MPKQMIEYRTPQEAQSQGWKGSVQTKVGLQWSPPSLPCRLNQSTLLPYFLSNPQLTVMSPRTMYLWWSQPKQLQLAFYHLGLEAQVGQFSTGMKRRCSSFSFHWSWSSLNTPRIFQVCARQTQCRGWGEACNLLPGSCRAEREAHGGAEWEQMALEVRRLQSKQMH